MGKLRLVPKETEPGFISFGMQQPALEPESGNRSDMMVKTKQGTTITIPTDMSLRQVARFVRMLENR